MTVLSSGVERRLDRTVSMLQPRLGSSELELEYNKRLMLVSGRANRELAAKIGSKLGVALGGVALKTFANCEV